MYWNDPTPLLDLLEEFSKTGRMDFGVNIEPILAKSIADSMRGATFVQKRQAVMDAFHVGDRQAERLLTKVAPRGRKPKVNDTKCADKVGDAAKKTGKSRAT
jgi:hypothetical protein